MKHHDKIKHFLAGAGAFYFGALLLHIALGYAFVVVAAVYKEALDSFTRKGNRWSYADIVATVTGGLFAHLLLWILT